MLVAICICVYIYIYIYTFELHTCIRWVHGWSIYSNDLERILTLLWSEVIGMMVDIRGIIHKWPQVLAIRRLLYIMRFTIVQSGNVNGLWIYRKKWVKRKQTRIRPHFPMYETIQIRSISIPHVGSYSHHIPFLVKTILETVIN